MKVVSIQPTPNPNAFKFVLDAVVCNGTKNYATVEEARGHQLAEDLFAIDGVERVFFCDAFLTVSMTPEADWRAVHEAATRAIEAATPEVIGDAARSTSSAPTLEGLSAADRELLDRINALLDDRVRPALAGDGGGLEVTGLAGKTLHIRYEGACGTCPSSVSGTLTAIEGLLQSEVDAELSVIPG